MPHPPYRKVMMPWEGVLMEAHAARMVGPRVLNIGFG